MEKLARLTTYSKGTKAEHDDFGFGGLSASDIAAALGKIRGDNAPSNLMRFKYCHDPREGRKLLAKIAGAIMLNTDVPLFMNTDLAILIMENSVMPQHCVICQGKGEMMAGELKIVCRACNGSGMAAKTDLYMAQALHISKDVWKATVEREYNRLMAIVESWEHRGRMAILEALVWEQK